MPGMAISPPKEEPIEEGISFEKPVVPKTLEVITKRRTQLPNRAQKVPTRPTRIYLADGSHKGIPVKVDATAADVIIQMGEKLSGFFFLSQSSLFSPPSLNRE